MTLSIPSKPIVIQDLEKRLAHFGFSAVYFSTPAQECWPDEVNNLKVNWYGTRSYTSEYQPGWRFIETIRPPHTAQKLREYGLLIQEKGFLEAIKHRDEFIRKPPIGVYGNILVDTYEQDPFKDIFATNSMEGWLAGAYVPEIGSRGMYLPQRLHRFFMSSIAQRLELPVENVRLPYASEYFQCLKLGGVLEFWPEFYVSEWLQDYIPGVDYNNNPYKYYGIIHSLFSGSTHSLRISTSLCDNHDTGSDKYNPLCGFRLVIEPSVE